MTSVGAPTRWAADQIENHCGYASAVLSGIVPDARHKDNGGYHCSINDLAAYGNLGDYSNERYLDKAPPVTTRGKDLACAVDISVSKSDMIKMYGRVKRVYDNRGDTRRRYVNAINVWDGVAGHSPKRFNFQRNTVSNASVDHEWHTHEDQPRAYVDVYRNEAEAWLAARAQVSIFKGETHAQWLASIGEDDMSVKDVTDGLNVALPYRSAGVGTWAKANGWANVSQRLLAEYTWVSTVKAEQMMTALLAAHEGLDHEAILARIDEHAAASAARDAADAQRDGELLALVQRVDSGEATAAEVVAHLRDMLHAATAPPAQG